ncbi:MAG: ATP-binding domain-containing [Parcubacteria group bacterium Gr01-1014_48]|nr:MAG: ATP-binding domain-containing [Parcubacteria group bacterium Greene0416_14]TSC72059.1 MAG: ATP-binding domain-containing [Parcubacteria group bacterium Gr01-1014_48]TSC99832.1 MAG: ATP-binding domain-containing [Parcubacteria group bacterium Greene1014_15]TSD07149.1 MAG: ATP-binding domain-containing [Parcubacteria group bacterium Greene0714_4]
MQKAENSQKNQSLQYGNESIPIVFDKSHLLTIGERLYSTSLDLIRELVSNAYDADATEVAIEIKPDRITVSDNGSGMNEEDLRRYFTIGSRGKRQNPRSPRFHRERIGEFGIGKFSALTLARQFVVETQHTENNFRARVVFDCDAWERDSVNWHLPLERLPLLSGQGGSTTITLHKLKKPLEVALVIRHVRERLPIGRPDFIVLVNGFPVEPSPVSGKRFPFAFETPYGRAHGEIILATLLLSKRTVAEAGITIRVRGVAVTTSLFGFEQSRAIGLSRLRGTLHADFLPITSSRDNIIVESPEFQAVHGPLRTEINKVLREARESALAKENVQASRVLKDALDKIGRALKRNPEALGEYSEEPPLGAESGDMPGTTESSEEGYSISKAQIVDSGPPHSMMPHNNNSLETPEGKKGARRRHVGLANRAIIRKMQFRNLGVICQMERFGADSPPSVFETGIIYINIDHPLYRKQQESDQLLQFFLTTLIAKELSLKKHSHDAAEAFRLQHEILTEAFRHLKKI